jgi:ATP-binding protein involved in chromosome partitioning
MGGIHKNFKVRAPDPRLAVIDERLKEVKRIIVVLSGKGGVGKSLIASTLSLLLKKRGYSVGLLDLDFHGPSCHIILGTKGMMPKEEKGIIPPSARGIKLMSVVYYVGDEPLPLRGAEISDAFTELLAITKWGRVDYLIVDVPPGIGEEVLDVIRLMKKGEFLIVTTPSSLVLKTVSKLTKLLLEMKTSILGVVENMRIAKTELVEEYAEKFGIRYLGAIHFDHDLEKCLGNPERLLKSEFASQAKNIADRILELSPNRRQVSKSLVGKDDGGKPWR